MNAICVGTYEYGWCGVFELDWDGQHGDYSQCLVRYKDNNPSFVSNDGQIMVLPTQLILDAAREIQKRKIDTAFG